MSIPLPTVAELALLDVLWTHGPSPVRTVQAELQADHPVGYTSVLKMLQLMTKKGLVRRDTSPRAHIYEPAVEKACIERRLVTDLLQRAFGGSPERLILHALAANRSSTEGAGTFIYVVDFAHKSLQRFSREGRLLAVYEYAPCASLDKS